MVCNNQSLINIMNKFSYIHVLPNPSMIDLTFSNQVNLSISLCGSVCAQYLITFHMRFINIY